MQRIVNVIMEGVAGDTRGIVIPRTEPFDPAQFLGEGYSFWRGPSDGNGLTGELDQDPRSFQLAEVNARDLYVDSPENRKPIHLDLWFFWTLFSSTSIVPLRQQSDFVNMVSCKHNGTTRKGLYGQILRSPQGKRSVLCVYSDGYRGVCWDVRQIFPRRKPIPALVIDSPV